MVWTDREARSRECYELLVQADGGHNPFPDDYFGSAFSNSVLEHILDVDTVLVETARVLKPGAPFYFCVPNERYLTELSITRLLGSQYTKWFKRISRVEHADDAAVWGKRLENAGFEIVRYWHYFSPAAMRVLEWGHYFGLPSLLARMITGKWMIAPGGVEFADNRKICPAIQLKPTRRGWYIHLLHCQETEIKTGRLNTLHVLQ